MFMSTLMSYLFQRLNIKCMTVAPYNHQSLQVKHGIKSLSTVLTKHLTGQGQMQPKFLPLATLAYNTFNSPNLANYSPYELVFGRKPKILLDIETDPDVKVSRMFKDYHILLNKRLKYLQDMLQQFNFFIAYGLGPRPLPHPYVYAIGLGPRPSYIFPLIKTAYEMGK